jgi:hypothetical protein
MMPRRYKGTRVDDLQALAPWAILAGVVVLGVLALVKGCGA